MSSLPDIEHPALSDTRSPWRIGLASARANLLPGLALQLLALTIVLLYYHNTLFAQLLENLVDFREATGWYYSLFSTALVGGVIPFLYLQALPQTRTYRPWAHFALYTGWWGSQGLVVDYFYQFQSWLWGDDPSFQTVLLKVLFDMFGFALFYATPANTLAYAWRDLDFSLTRLLRYTRGPWIRRAVVPTLIANWSVWMPAVSLIYCMPTPLQLPLFSLVLCFWSLMLAHISSRHKDLS